MSTLYEPTMSIRHTLVCTALTDSPAATASLGRISQGSGSCFVEGILDLRPTEIDAGFDPSVGLGSRHLPTPMHELMSILILN